MSHLAKALRPDEEKIRSKGVRSVQSRVMNLETRLGMDAGAFRRRFAEYILKTEKPEPYVLTAEDIAAAEELRRTKYSTFSWNYGYSPKYAFHKKQRFAGGGVEVYLDIRDGVISDAKIYGDFLDDAEPLIKKLCGIRHDAEEIGKVLMGQTLGTISQEELLQCFL